MADKPINYVDHIKIVQSFTEIATVKKVLGKWCRKNIISGFPVDIWWRLNDRHFHETSQASRDTKRPAISYTQVNECQR